MPSDRNTHPTNMRIRTSAAGPSALNNNLRIGILSPCPSLIHAKSWMPATLFRWTLSGVLQQLHESEVHVQLHVTVKQRQARIVGDEIHGGGTLAGNADD